MTGEQIAEAKISSKMQITIPKNIQKILRVETGDYILFYLENGKVFIRKGKMVPSS